MPVPYADHLEAAHACFAAFEVRAWSGRIGMAKPDHQLFDHVREALGVAPADALFIDDHAGNVEAARACGWQAIQFTGAAQCKRQLQARALL
jgi:HAD superfamily hydrolase (TIGR01509 family)